jgi:hypothetical protein
LQAGFASAYSLVVFAAGFAAAGFFDASATGASGAARNRASGEIDERYVARIRSGSLLAPTLPRSYSKQAAAFAESAGSRA